MLNLHLPRDKVTKNLHITERALLPTFLNRLAAVGLKIEQERLEEFLVKEVTRVVSVSVGVARDPGLNVIVLSMSAALFSI
jgi:hypothetical protein